MNYNQHQHVFRYGTACPCNERDTERRNGRTDLGKNQLHKPVQPRTDFGETGSRTGFVMAAPVPIKDSIFSDSNNNQLSL